MYSTPAHSANRALSPSSKSSSSLLSCCYRSSHCFGPDWLRADHIKQHECRGKILWLGVGSGYRLTTRTCASFCKLDRIHALNHRRNKFLHTYAHARTLTRGRRWWDHQRDPKPPDKGFVQEQDGTHRLLKVFKSALGLVAQCHVLQFTTYCFNLNASQR